MMSLLAAASLAVFFEAGIGSDHHIEQGSNPRSVLRLRIERGPWVVEFNHHSSFRDGWPFNNRAEQLTNQWSVIYRVPLWKVRE